MSLSDLIAFPLLLAAILAGAMLSLTRSERGRDAFAIAHQLCVRVALSGVMLIFTLLLRGHETGFLALLPVLLLALEVSWDLLTPCADPEDS